MSFQDAQSGLRGPPTPRPAAASGDSETEEWPLEEFRQAYEEALSRRSGRNLAVLVFPGAFSPDKPAVLAVNAVPEPLCTKATLSPPVHRRQRDESCQRVATSRRVTFTMIRTGWSRLTTGWGTTSAESAAIDQLLNTHRALLLDGGRAEVGSEAGYSACAIFLSSVETAAKTFCLEAAPRGYRKKFSANYRALFPDDARHYRVDVLEASADQHSAIWVNGDKFELSPEAICHAEALQKAWSDLTQLLEACNSSDGSRHPGRSELCAVLDSLDVAWAGFEHKPLDGKECHELQRALVQGIAHLNSVANFRRKGRDDLGFDILESATEVLIKFGLSSKDIESWEIGARYVRQRTLFEANNDIVAEFRIAQTLAPAFTTMCTDCDVELFLVLPRMMGHEST
eukprot:g22741.t1